VDLRKRWWSRRDAVFR